GIRDLYVTGVQTCALPILAPLDTPHGQRVPRLAALVLGAEAVDLITQRAGARSIDVVVLLGCDDRRPGRGGGAGGRRWHGWGSEIGRASCRERGESAGVGG